MSEAEIINPTVISRGFPDICGNEIHREHILDSIDKSFYGSTNLLFLEGEDGIGKTTLLSQYSKRHCENTITLFIRPTCKLGYSIEYLSLVLSEQIYSILNNDSLPYDNVDQTILNMLLIRLQRKAYRTKTTYMFCIDGLSEIPDGNNQIQKILIQDVLQIGLPGFKYIISGDSRNFSQIVHQSIKFKTYPMTAFSLDESKRYLNNADIGDDSSFEDIHRLCRGIPGNLASVKRLIDNGIDLSHILEEDPSDHLAFLMLEWESIKYDNEDEQLVFGIIAFARHLYSISDLSRLLSIEENKISSLAKRSIVLRVDEKNNTVTFISEGHRKFAQSRLSLIRDQVIDIIINDLIKRPDAPESFLNLPTYYEQSGKYNDLINFLTPDVFKLILANCQSFYPLTTLADTGIACAKKLNKNDELIRFSMQKAIVAELNGSAIWKSEIEARLLIEDYDSAISLAQRTVSKEDRLHLFAIIIKSCKVKGIPCNEELIKQIEHLYSQIDLSKLGDKAAVIASDLIYVNTDMAINMVETAASGNNDDYNRSDRAFAKLSFAILDSEKNKDKDIRTCDKTLSKIKDPKMKDFVEAISVFYEEYTADEIVTHVEKLHVEERFFTLRLWALSNKSCSNASIAIEYFLDNLIKETLYTPKTRDLREIATPLPHIENTETAKSIVARFDILKDTIEHIGTSVDYVRLQLILAETEIKYDFVSAQERILNIYYYIEEIDDLSTKCECLAWFLSSLHIIDSSGIIEKNQGVCQISISELKSDIIALLGSTAEQLEVVEGMLKALTVYDIDLVLSVISELNTQERRDNARKIVIDTLLKEKNYYDYIDILSSVKNDIIDRNIRDISHYAIIKHIHSKWESLSGTDMSNILTLINTIQNIRNTELRCEAYSLSYSILFHIDNNLYASLLESITTKLNESWNKIDSLWDKVDVGFKITKLMATDSKDIALYYMKETEKLMEESGLDSAAAATTYIGCLRIAIRAFSGLLSKGLDEKEDLLRIKYVIGKLPSYSERIGLWTELALRSYSKNRTDLMRQIVREHIKPLIELSEEYGLPLKESIISMAAPALFCDHHATAITEILKLSAGDRAIALSLIGEFLLFRLPTNDPNNSRENDPCDIDYETIVDIIDVIKHMEKDDAIYYFIKKISDSIVHNRSKTHYTIQQKVDIADRLKNIVASKLPDINNIKHDGYSIVASAQIGRITNMKEPYWTDLRTKAGSITNIADRVLILCIISTAMPSKYTAKRDEFIDEAIQIVDTIPSDYDRMERHIDIAELIIEVNIKKSKECLNKALNFSIRKPGSKAFYRKQKRIIDVAHRIDPDYAESLAAIVDDDPARQNTQFKLRRQLQLLNTKKYLADPENGFQKNENNKSEIPYAAWMNLGQLNGNRLSPIHFDKMIDTITMASEYPLSDAFPIISWVIENSVKRHENTEQARLLIRPIFESILLATEMATNMSVKSLEQMNKSRREGAKAFEDHDGIVISPGERENAIHVIKTWFEEQMDDYLIINDPYFGVEELEFIKILQAVNPQCEFKVVSSICCQKKRKYEQPLETTYQTQWRLKISETAPPDTEIIIIGTETTGEPPIHDRWMITNTRGLAIGTSLNSIGRGKIARIEYMSKCNADECRHILMKYVNREIKEHKNEKLKYLLFTL